MLLHGLVAVLPWWGYLLIALLLTHLSVIATTVYLHRSQAHHALDVHPALAHAFRFWLWLTTGTRTSEWVSIHRKHHAKCETVDDPHSPQILGLPKVFFFGYQLYRDECKNKETMQRYGFGMPNDWLENVLYEKSWLGLSLMLMLDVLLFGLPGLAIFAVQIIWMPLFAAGVVNGIGHVWGYRNYECNDASRNIIPWGILAGGEELHNNHHTFASSAKLSVRKWEFDIGWGYIKALQWMHLAKVKRLPPEIKMVRNKINIDVDTITTVIGNRLQVMTNYSRQVILPVLQEEKRRASSTGKILLKHARSLLMSADMLLDEMGKQKLKAILEEQKNLQLVYQYREKLQQIWTRTTATQRELIEALQEWCKQAETTGVASLQGFAQRIRGYTMVSHNP